MCFNLYKSAKKATKYRRHTDPNGGYDQNEIKRNKALNYFKQNCPIFLVCNTNLPQECQATRPLDNSPQTTRPRLSDNSPPIFRQLAPDLRTTRPRSSDNSPPIFRQLALDLQTTRPRSSDNSPPIFGQLAPDLQITRPRSSDNSPPIFRQLAPDLQTTRPRSSDNSPPIRKHLCYVRKIYFYAH